MKKMRIDKLLVEKGLVADISQAQRIIMAGKVRVNDQLVPNPSSSYNIDNQITIAGGPSFVSRGGENSTLDCVNLISMFLGGFALM